MNKILLVFFLIGFTASSQHYSDYLGAGHNNGITVTSSSEQSRANWVENASAENTINGRGLDARLLETSRFLAQATFGTKLEYIKTVAEGTFEDWIDEQFELPSPPLAPLTQEIYDEALAMFVANGGNAEDYFGPYHLHFQYAWWQSNINNEDLLRHRIALALSQIMVVSWNSNLGDYGVGIGSYYDTLKDNAFGNFRDLLLDITLHPMMGGYLSHYNNPRSFPAQNAHPDENYAREIMQLFSIGLYELNQDGSYKLDGNGDRIPTYDNDDIKEFAKIFTGLGPAEVRENPWGVTANFGVNFWFAKKDVPLAMYENWHQPGEKHLLNGTVVPAGQDGMKDIDDGIDNLFNHPNVGPFIALRLIQQLVKSNPTPAYISRVSAAFNSTNGVRGNMKAVIKAILLDPEARNCSWIENPSHGKLIEPMQRYFNVTRQIDLENSNGNYWNIGWPFFNATKQLPLGATHVFNFYPPDFVPNNEFADENLVGPELMLHNSATSLAYINEVDSWTWPEYVSVLTNWEEGLDGTPLNFNRLKYFAKDSEVLVNELDKLFTKGQLSNETRRIIIDAIDPMIQYQEYVDYLHYRVKLGLYLILISPDYAILR